MTVLKEQKLKPGKETLGIGSVICLYAFNVSVIASSNSLLVIRGSNLVMLSAVVFVFTLAGCGALWLSHRVEKNVLTRWAIWVLVLVIVLVATMVLFGGFHVGYTLFFLSFGTMPLAFYILKDIGLLDALVRSFTNVVLVLAVASLALWLIGPIMGLISPNCYIYNNWTDGVDFVKPGYFHLLYVSQFVSIFNSVIPRNTGLFYEAPMWALVLCIALLFEIMYREKSRKVVVAILLATVVSTISSTAISMALMLLTLNLLRSISLSKHFNPLRLYVLIALACVGSLVITMMIGERLDGFSGSIRVDDFQAGIRSWLDSPFVGNGYNADTVTQYMQYAYLREGRFGFSNSVADILARGGILGLFPFLVGLYGLWRDKKHGGWVFAICFCFIWTLTISTKLPVTAFVLSFGILCLLEGPASRVSLLTTPVEETER